MYASRVVLSKTNRDAAAAAARLAVTIISGGGGGETPRAITRTTRRTQRLRDESTPRRLTPLHPNSKVISYYRRLRRRHRGVPLKCIYKARPKKKKTSFILWLLLQHSKMSIFRLEPSSPDFIFILLYYYIISLLTSARTRDAEHVIILLYRRTAHTHTHTLYACIIYGHVFITNSTNAPPGGAHCVHRAWFARETGVGSWGLAGGLCRRSGAQIFGDQATVRNSFVGREKKNKIQTPPTQWNNNKCIMRTSSLSCN